MRPSARIIGKRAQGLEWLRNIRQRGRFTLTDDIPSAAPRRYLTPSHIHMEPELVSLSLVCRVASQLCALPLESVDEALRPLPVDPMAEMPAFVLGLTLLRGAPTPVVDARALLGLPTGIARRFVSLRAGERRVALAVDDTLGVRSLSGALLKEIPPLLSKTRQEVVSAIGTLDAQLLLVLSASRLVPDDVWTALHRERHV